MPNIINVEDKFKSLLEAAPDAMVIVNQRGAIVLVNAQAERLFQYRRQDLLGKTVEDLIPQRFRKGHVHHRANYSRDPHVRSMGAGLDLYGLRKDGSEVPVEISLSPLQTQEGRVFIAAIRDITERKKTEAAMATSRHIFRAEETERRRIARELHDSLNQLLSSARFRMQVLDSQLKPSEEKSKESVRAASQALKSAMQEVRRISQNLRPVILDDLGLIPALRSLCEDFEKVSGINCGFRSSDVPRLPQDLEFVIYRIVQEGLTNIRKHSKAKRAHVAIEGRKTSLFVTIQDNGKGFAGAALKKTRGSGMTNMTDRAKFTGGDLTIESKRGSGTTVTFRLPLNHGA